MSEYIRCPRCELNFIQKKVRRFLPNKGKLNSIWRENIKKEC